MFYICKISSYLLILRTCKTLFCFFGQSHLEFITIYISFHWLISCDKRNTNILRSVILFRYLRYATPTAPAQATGQRSMRCALPALTRRPMRAQSLFILPLSSNFRRLMRPLHMYIDYVIMRLQKALGRFISPPVLMCRLQISRCHPERKQLFVSKLFIEKNLVISY